MFLRKGANVTCLVRRTGTNGQALKNKTPSMITHAFRFRIRSPYISILLPRARMCMGTP